ncbi:MAG: hypothetical protein NZ602_11680 [Thermoguttaceae bacterium]|nr:hypothetical protein [Thermoguttaceae bacterium]
MTALDQAFIKAYLQQAGAAKTGRRASESLPNPTSAEKNQPPQQPLSAADAPRQSLGDHVSVNPSSHPSSIHPEGNCSLSAENSPSIENNTVNTAPTENRSFSGKAVGGNRKSVAKPGGRKRIAYSTPSLSLVDVLEEKDRGSSVGLPDRRILQQLGTADRQGSTAHPSVKSPHILSKELRKTTPRSPQIPKLSGISPESPECSDPAERSGENRPDGEPECILEFPTCCQEQSDKIVSFSPSLSVQKLPKNPRKITLRDLEIPREVCFFEPPSPTIPLHEPPQRSKLRGKPELPRVLERPRLNLFVPDAKTGQSLRPDSSMQQIHSSRQQLHSGSGGVTGLSSDGLNQESEADRGVQGMLRLRTAPEGGRPPASYGKAADTEPTPTAHQCQAEGDSVPATLVPGAPVFSPYWYVKGFHWPKVCLALEAKAPAALDRMAEAILVASKEHGKIIGFASVQAGQGATTLLLCAARRLAARNCGVLLVEANLRHPDLADRLNVAPQVGWSDLGQRCRALQEVLIESHTDKVTLLPWAGSVQAGAEQRSSFGTAITDGLKGLRSQYDVILVDLGGLEGLGEKPSERPRSPLCLVEGVVVVRNVRTSGGQLELGALRQRLEEMGVPVVGIVDNCV